MANNTELESAVARWSERLLVDGYCVIPDLVLSSEVAELDAELAADFEATPFCEGRFYGERTKRFGRLLARSPRAAQLVQNELVLGVVERVLSPWCDTIQLNLAQAIGVQPARGRQRRIADPVVDGDGHVTRRRMTVAEPRPGNVQDRAGIVDERADRRLVGISGHDRLEGGIADDSHDLRRQRDPVGKADRIIIEVERKPRNRLDLGTDRPASRALRLDVRIVAPHDQCDAGPLSGDTDKRGRKEDCAVGAGRLGQERRPEGRVVGAA